MRSIPWFPGHEVAGVVEKIGPGVTWPQWATASAWRGCSPPADTARCACRATRCCVSSPMRSRESTKDGGYQEYMIAPAAYVAPIPDGLDFAEAGPLMCAGLTVFNGMRNAGFQPGQKVAVIGLGGLGHLGVLYAKAMGARVAVISNTPDKEAEARETTAPSISSTRKAKKAGDALKEWDGGADIILATAPSSEAATDAFPGLAPDGTLVVLGVGRGRNQGISDGPGRRAPPPDGFALRQPQRHSGHAGLLRAQSRACRISPSSRWKMRAKRWS